MLLIFFSNSELELPLSLRSPNNPAQRVIKVFLIIMALISCSVTSHPTIKSTIRPSLKQSSDVKFRRILSAKWQIDRSGLINLDHPTAIKAGIKDELEPIEIYFYAIEHPSGLYLIDTGVSKIIFDEDKTPIPWIMKSMMNFDLLVPQTTTEEFIARSAEVKGVFLTHMHADHIMGLPAVRNSSDIYIGPNESSFTHMRNLGVNGVTDDLLAGHKPLKELHFPKNTGSGLSSIDFFGDQSLIIYHTPGHTPGSLAFQIKTLDSYHLVTGDTCHTVWGWNNGVTPGEFTLDHDENQKSLLFLKNIAKKLNAKVHLGHQSLY